MTYEFYFSSALTSILINSHGKIVVPSLINTDKQVQEETRRYYVTWYKTAIRDPSVLIDAQVRDFRPRALHRRLRKLSRKFRVPMEELAKRTRVTFVGEMDFGRLMKWVTKHMADPEKAPVFEQSASQTLQISGFDAPFLLSGSVSLVEAVRRSRQPAVPAPAFRRRPVETWKALEFLQYAKQLGFEVGDYDCMASVEDIEKRVFKVIANWHFNIIREPKRKKRGGFATKRGKVPRDPDEMAQLVYALIAGLL